LLLKLFIKSWIAQPKDPFVGFAYRIHLRSYAAPLQGNTKLIQYINFRLKFSEESVRSFCLFLIACFFLFSKAESQQVLISNTPQSVCTGQFLDDSGTTGSYSNNNYTFTLCSSSPGQAVSLLFQGVSIGADANNSANSDYLSIYDGNTVNASTLIAIR